MMKRLMFAAVMLLFTAGAMSIPGCEKHKPPAPDKQDMAKKTAEEAKKSAPIGKFTPTGSAPIVNVTPQSDATAAPPSAEQQLLKLAAEQMNHELARNNPKLDENQRREAQKLAKQAEQQRNEIYHQRIAKEKRP